MKVLHLTRAAGLLAGALLAAGSAAAQTASFSDVPDTFRIEAGGFRIGSDTQLTFNETGSPTPPIDFESLKVPDSTTKFYIEGFWRPWRRHQFSASWYRNNRDGTPVTAQRDFVWGDRVISAGATVTGRVGSNYLSGVYRFAAYKNDRFEIGPALGIGHLNLDAGITGSVSATIDGVTVSAPFELSRSLGQVTGDVGGFFTWWPARRLLIRGDMRYILVKPEKSEASITDGRASAVYHFVRHAGIGLQYTYTKFRYDRDIVSKDLGGSLRYSGVQVVFAGAF